MRQTRKTTKRVLVSILSAALMISTLTGCGGKDDSGTDSTKDKGATSAETDSEKDEGASKPKVKSESEKKAISNPRIEADGSVTWDKIKFGSYTQSVEFEYEPIKWRILSVDEDNNALLLADMGLDCKPYNTESVENANEDGDSYSDYSCTWENCTLRTWLNEDFYKEAFNEEEQAVIKQVKVKNDDNPEYGTKGGKDTTDKVYLLSIEEASNSEYGFDSAFDTSATRECEVTDYARMNGAWRSSRSGYDGNGYWWLRSQGFSSSFAAYVNYDGWGYYDGSVISRGDMAIRPALQINLSSSLVTDAGEVASDGTVTDAGDGYNNPKITDNGTVWDCVYFGGYKQNCVSEKEPIEWRVLSVDGDEALLLADMGLDCKPYNEENENVTWETCAIRTWLNEEFYKEAFNEEEQAAIKQVILKNDDNPELGTKGGNDTTDKVYLLSIEEASNSAYGFDSAFEAQIDTRESQFTDYARMNGAWISGSSDYAGNGCWWLRSPGRDSKCAVKVGSGGWCDIYGDNVFCDDNVIRPALRINLSSSVWEAAGTVTTGPGAVESDKPTQTPELTNEP